MKPDWQYVLEAVDDCGCMAVLVVCWGAPIVGAIWLVVRLLQ